MPILGWIVVTIVVASAAAWLARRDVANKVAEVRQMFETEQARADSMVAEAARLPDALDRERKAVEKIESLTNELRAAESSAADINARFNEAIASRDQAIQQLQQLSRELEQAREKVQEAKLNANTSLSSLENAQQDIAELRGRLERMEQSKDKALEDLRIRGEEFAAMSAARDAAIELANQSKVFVENARDAMRTTFVEAASAVFDEKSAVLDRRIKESGETSKVRLEETLKPFADNVHQFRQRMEEINASQTRENATLQGAIGKLQELNQNMASATNELSRALKGNAKARGDWGEMILETVLKASGLEEGRNYRRQASSKDDETGQRRQPDVVVDMPDGRQVVIDSKVNLIAWAEANAADSQEVRQEALIRHAAALRAHAKDLSDKNYPKVLGDQALEITVLFVPIEGALAAALTVDSNLQADAFGRRIAFASPNTLMAMLKLVERLWTRDRLQKQVDVIGTEAGKLLDSLSSFLEDFKLIEERIAAVSKAYSNAKNRLNDSNQSVVARAKRLVDAGARGKKTLPEVLLPDPGEDTLLLPHGD